MTTPDNAVSAPQRCVFLTSDETVKRVGLSLSTLYRLVDSSEFPKPVRLLKTRVAWVEHEVEAWMHKKIAERDSGK